ncbi:beta-glucosidase 5 [Dendryphion nanum]|uniref:Probable beta-glucosidase btgE n=1 Tax=Dendryphion nanum TaxID=256645 RepID=A0A9P9DSB6_9PLEO|nr:beta-glucosidase 5 [Dendryphion nanum]
MKASIVAAALVGSAAASHNAHAGFHLRRNEAPENNVCTVYTTVYVYPSDIPVPVYNSTLSVKATPSVHYPVVVTSSSEVPAYTPAPQPTKEAYTPAPQPSKEAEPSKEAYTPAPQPSKEAYTPAPQPSSSKAEEKPKPSQVPSYGGNDYSGTGRIVTKGKKWGVTYTPYTSGGQCKDKAEVQKDIKEISGLGFTTIRSYSTDCGVFENVVPEASKYGLKIIYGIYIDAGKPPFSNGANEQLQAIIKGSPKDSIAMIIVGNEVLFNNVCSAENLAKYILYVKEQLAAAGFPKDIAITTTEPVNIWEEKGAPLCDVIDVFAVQTHPFFTSSVSPSEAGKFAKQQLEQAAKVCAAAAAKGKYITEIGWPHTGNSNGKAVPGYAEQAVAIKSIIEEVGYEAVLFSAQDDKWKAPGAYNVEQNWGCVDAIKASGY